MRASALNKVIVALLCLIIVSCTTDDTPGRKSDVINDSGLSPGMSPLDPSNPQASTHGKLSLGLVTSDSQSQVSQKVRSSDEPTAIFINVTEVTAYHTVQGWLSVSKEPKQIELLQLSQNAPALMSEQLLPPGTYTEIRIKIAPDATIVINNLSKYLKIPSAAQSGIKLKNTFEIKKGFITAINLDFNLVKSLVVKGNDDYSLKPVIRIAGVTEDLQPPTIAIVKPLVGYSNEPQQIVEVEYFDEYIDTNSLSVKINGLESKADFTIDQDHAIATYTLVDGAYSIEARIADKAKSVASADPVTIVIDTVKPVISLGLATDIMTKEFQIILPVEVTDINPAYTEIKVNDLQVLTTGAKQFSIPITLTLEGDNKIEVVSTDLAGNVSEVATLIIERDTIAPILSEISPTDGQVMELMSFLVSGTSNESLSSVTVNGTAFPLQAGNKTFSDTYVSEETGPVELEFIATDLVGNESSKIINIEVTKPVIYGRLISIKPSVDNIHLIVKGAPGASRPGARITAYTGFFGFADDQKISNADGSFALKTSSAGLIRVKGLDLQTSETATVDLPFDLSTSLAGVVFDTNGAPIPGVTVRVIGSNSQAVTDGAGSFEFLNVVSGDQTIEFNGTTALQPTDGIDRKFSITKVKLSIGVGQRNTLVRPVYLATMIMDGSGTPLIANGSTTVTSDDAPGVRIEIGSNTAHLPPIGVNEIFVRTIPAERSTVYPPLQAEPVNVYSLEPSGTTFTQRAQVTIPNENELPVGTELLIFSMNSETGQWELDGRGKVTSDGQSVQTNPGEGISHFSLIYAVPLKPLISEVGDPNVKGIDVGKGSFSTSVSLPSYKSIDKTVTPGLIYKSTWAKPTAFVSNRIDIPKMNSVMTFGQRNSKYETACPVAGICSIQEILIAIHNDTFVSDETMYIPDMIRSQAFIGSLRSNLVKFVDSTEIPSDRGEVISGPVFDESLNTDIVSMTGIPNKSVISYAVPLKDEETGEYLKTGNYPYIARYEIRLKALTMRTITSTTSVFIDGKRDENNSGTTYAYDKFVSAIKDVLPEDVLGNVLVKNRVNSEFGRGWDLNLIQRIANPNSQRLIVEETDGSMSTYALKSSISTVMNGVAGEDLSQAVSINWPEVNYIKADSNGQPQVVSRLLDGNSTPNVLFKPSVINLTMANQNQTSCPAIFGSELICPYVPYLKNPNLPTDPQRPDLNQAFYQAQRNAYGYYNSYTFPVSVNPQLSGFVTAQDGTIFYTNPKDHSLWRGAGASFTRVGGATLSVDEVYGGQGGAINIKFDGSNYAPIQEFCQSRFGTNCGTGTQAARTNCSFTYEFVAGELTAYNSRQNGCGSDNPTFLSGACSCDIFQPSHFFKGINSSGQVGVPRYSGDDGSGAIGAGNVGFNNPGQIVAYTPGVYLVADTGNNRVRLVNMNNNLVTTFAGDGSNFDGGDGVDARLAKILHPIGLLVSRTGEVYISSERGYIRKVDTNGNLTIVGGAPAEAGGVQAEEGPIATFALHKPSHMVLDQDRNLLYISEPEKHRVVKFDFNTQRAVQVAGNGTCSANPSAAVQNALNHSLCFPGALALDDNKNLIIVDVGHQQIKRINEFGAPNGLAVFEPSSRDLSVINRLADGFERIYRNGDKVKFDLAGKQIEQIDRVGRVTTFNYNNDFKLTKLRDHVGNELNLEYSGNLLEAITDPANRRTSFSYSGGKLIAVNYPDGTIKKYDYDINGLLTKEINQRNAATKYEYNEWSRLHKIINPLNEEVVLNDMVSGTMTNDYTGGQIGQFQQTGVGAGKANDKLTDAKGTTTEIVKDHNGFLWKVKDALGNVTNFHKDADGKTTKVIFPDNSEVKMTYDAATEDLLTKTDVSTGITESFTYNGFGDLTAKKDGRNLITSRLINSQGLVSKILYPDLTTTEFTFNNLGLVETTTTHPIASKNLTTQNFYDAKGMVIRSIDSAGKETSHTYDFAGNRLSTTTSSSVGITQVTRFEYDSFNRLSKVISANNEVTTYLYLPTGELEKIIDPKNNVAVFEYDIKGQLKKKITPDGKIYLMTYDANGNLQQQTDPNGKLTTHTFDPLNRISNIQYGDDFINYKYNLRGEVSQLSNKDSTIDYNKDSMGRISSASISGKGEISDYPYVNFEYTYDKSHNRNSMIANGQSAVYGFDSMNRLRSMTTLSGANFNFDYDNSNRLTQISRPGSTTNYSYTDASMLQEINHLNGSENQISNLQYSFDDRNFPIQRRTPTTSENYIYDANGQLTQAGTETFSYDSLGNRLADNIRNYTFDQFSQRLSEDINFYYLYDENGNLISKTPKDSTQQSMFFTYSGRNQLIKIQWSSGGIGSTTKEASYIYDALGRRLQKKFVDYLNTQNNFTRKFVYDEENIAFEYDENNALLATHTHSLIKDDDILVSYITSQGAQAGLADSSGSIYYLKDRLGSITEVINNSGQLIQRNEYSAFGALRLKNSMGIDITNSPVIKTSFTFTGREYDNESGMYYYRARYYDANNGRFIQVDPDSGEMQRPLSHINKYIYVANNPVLFTDPSGRITEDDVLEAIAPNVHGNYCGKSAVGNPKGPKGRETYDPPEDGLDETCKNHDQAYANRERWLSPNLGFSLDRAYWDARLTVQSAAAISKQPGKGLLMTQYSYLMLTVYSAPKLAIDVALFSQVLHFIGIPF